MRGSAWHRAVGTLSLAVLLTACTAAHEGQGRRAGPGSATSPSSPSSDPAKFTEDWMKIRKAALSKAGMGDSFE